jgi:hypothetical protein
MTVAMKSWGRLYVEAVDILLIPQPDAHNGATPVAGWGIATQ